MPPETTQNPELVIEQLQQDLEAANAKISVLTEENAKLKEELEMAEGIITEMQGMVKAKPVAGKTTIEHDGEQYNVVIPRFKHKGEIYTAADLESNPDLVADLLEIGSGILVKA